MKKSNDRVRRSGLRQPPERRRPSTGHVASTISAAALTALIARRHHLTRAITPDLRDWTTYLPLYVDNRVVLGAARRLLEDPSQVQEGVEMEQRSIGGPAGAPPVTVFVYTPRHDRTAEANVSDSRTGALLWIHGGGFVAGKAHVDHAICSFLAAELGCVVVSVDYRLAPENPFPAGLEDCYAALRWTASQADGWGFDGTRVAVAGASAGGGMAATLAQLALDRDEVPVIFQLLVYPMLDDRTTLRRRFDGRGKFTWTPRSNRWAWTMYLGHRPDPTTARPYAVASRRDDLTGLPPAWIGLGDLDLFHDEDLLYAERLRAAGVECETHIVPGMIHGADVKQHVSSMQDFRARWVRALMPYVGPRSS